MTCLRISRDSPPLAIFSKGFSPLNFSRRLNSGTWPNENEKAKRLGGIPTEEAPTPRHLSFSVLLGAARLPQKGPFADSTCPSSVGLIHPAEQPGLGVNPPKRHIKSECLSSIRTCTVKSPAACGMKSKLSLKRGSSGNSCHAKRNGQGGQDGGNSTYSFRVRLLYDGIKKELILASQIALLVKKRTSEEQPMPSDL